MLLVQSYTFYLGLAPRTCDVRRVSPHMLKALPCDIILQNGFYVWGRVWGYCVLLGVESRRYEHTGSKRHYAHRNEGRTYISHRDSFSQFGRRSIQKNLLRRIGRIRRKMNNSSLVPRPSGVWSSEFYARPLTPVALDSSDCYARPLTPAVEFKGHASTSRAGESLGTRLGCPSNPAIDHAPSVGGASFRLNGHCPFLIPSL